jgi:hypothetical protein
LDDEEYYAELRALAQSLAAARREAARRLTPELRDETPDWLLERLDAALRAIDAAERDVGRFIREDRAGISSALPIEDDAD